MEAKSYFEKGIIVRLDSKGSVLGIDITDSTEFFSGDDDITLKEACKILGVSESTLRRRIKERKIPYKKPNNKNYRFKRRDFLKAA
jgi:excisionase family DNA binding protein